MDDPRAPSFLQDVVAWTQSSFVDIVSADLTLLEAQDKANSPYPTQNVRMKFLLVLAQHAGVLFPDTAIKVKAISNLLRAILLRSKERERYMSTVSTRAARGYLGGAVAAHPTHPFLFAPVQQHALELLEILARQHSTLAAEHVLYILYECEALCVAEGKRNHHIVCPSMEERLSLAIRRVRQCCPDGSGSAVRRPKSFHMETVLPQALLKEDNTKTSKLISERKASVAYSNYDNSMSDAFAPGNRQRRVSGNAQLDLHGSGEGHALLNAIWRQRIDVDSFSLPVDVQNEYGAFSLHALSGLVQAGAKADEIGKPSISSADVMAVIDDVLDAHMSVPMSTKLPSTAPADLEETSSVISRIHEIRDCRQWVQLNGSCDMFSVLGAVTCCDPITRCVDVCFRIVNSSGFKVPIFALQLLLGAHEQPDGKELVMSFETEGHSPRSGGTASGVEYFLPGAIVERTFNFSVRRLGALFAVLRIVYQELLPDIDMVEVFRFAPSGQTRQHNHDASTGNIDTNGTIS